MVMRCGKALSEAAQMTGCTACSKPVTAASFWVESPRRPAVATKRVRHSGITVFGSTVLMRRGTSCGIARTAAADVIFYGASGRLQMEGLSWAANPHLRMGIRQRQTSVVPISGSFERMQMDPCFGTRLTGGMREMD